jgi:hypothetical protein
LLIVWFPSGSIARAQPATTQEDAAAKAKKEAEKKATEEAGKKRDEEKALDKFKGAGFGAGLSLTVIPSPGAGIKSAEVIGGVVRVTEVQHSVPRLLLETHYFFVPQHKFLKMVDETRWGWGPYLGIQNGSDEIVRSIGAGAMIGFRRALDKSDSFNFGVGGIYDTSVKTLGDGIKENQTLPTGETVVRFKTIGKWGWLFIFSFGF